MLSRCCWLISHPHDSWCFPWYFPKHNCTSTWGSLSQSHCLHWRAALCWARGIFKSRLSFEAYSCMNLFYSQTEIEVLFQCLVMNYLSIFIIHISITLSTPLKKSISQEQVDDCYDREKNFSPVNTVKVIGIPPQIRFSIISSLSGSLYNLSSRFFTCNAPSQANPGVEKYQTESSP